MCELGYHCTPEYNIHGWRVYHFIRWNKCCNSNGSWDHSSHFRSKVGHIQSMIDKLCTAVHVHMCNRSTCFHLYCSPNLSWRDVQYLLVYTSNPSLTSGGNYSVNGAGILVSHQFGFGVMDAEAMVTRARHWISVPPQLDNVLNVPTSTG